MARKKYKTMNDVPIGTEMLDKLKHPITTNSSVRAVV